MLKVFRFESQRISHQGNQSFCAACRSHSWLVLMVALAAAALFQIGPSMAQSTGGPDQAGTADSDSSKQAALPRRVVIRFLTETDYPPFNFTGPDGNPAGFNVDLARALCDEIKVTCTIQMRRFETLIDALATNRGDAIIASMAVTPQLRAKVDFTDPYYRAPARFVSRRDNVMPEIRPEYLEGKKVGVIAGTSHEAYLKAMFTDAEIHSYPDNDALRAALRRGNATADRFEAEGVKFHQDLRDAYRQIAAEDPERCVLIDATADPDTVAATIWSSLREHLRATFTAASPA